MSSVLYLDCFSGASGDMLLGAFLDLGVPLEGVREALGSLRLDGVEIGCERVRRAGVSATKFHVHERGVEGADHEHGPAHGHTHGHTHDHSLGRAQAHTEGHDSTHRHRSLSQIEALIERSALSAEGRDRARLLVRRLAEAEAAIHQMPVEQVHLHEVGATDSIVDIVGGVFAFEMLGVDEVMASPLNTGSGMVRCAHGVFPVPAPATLRLVEGVPIYADGPEVELLTPTGALLVTGHAHCYGPLPPMTTTGVGYGAGTRDFADRPNVLRAVLGQRVDRNRATTHRVVVLEFEVDDMNPQLFGPLMDALYGAGALEVFYAPVYMKKNRPGVLVTVVSPPGHREALTSVVFRETTTIGLRYHEMTRDCLERTHVTVDTPVGAVRLKVATREGQVLNAAPEFEDCARLAHEHRLPVKDVHALALKAYLERHRVY